MACVPGAFFYGFTGINKPWVFDQTDRAYYLSYFINGCIRIAFDIYF